MLEGIDVSNWQGDIDWAQVRAAGKRFAFIKSSEGTAYADPYFLQNWTGAKDNKIVPGAYHFARPALNSADTEADFFIDLMGGPTFARGELIALDLEDDPAGNWLGDLGDWALQWLQRVEAGCGVKPVLYSGNYFLRAHGLVGRDDLADYGLWLASWQDTLPPPTPNWPVVAFWQYDANGTCPGVNGNCDLDRFMGTIRQLKQYGAP